MKSDAPAPAPRRHARKLPPAFVGLGALLAAVVVLFLSPGHSGRKAVQIQFSYIEPSRGRAVFSVTNAARTTVHFRTSLHKIDPRGTASYSSGLLWGSANSYAPLGPRASRTMLLTFLFDRPQPGFDPDIFSLHLQRGEVIWYEDPSRLQKFQTKLMEKLGAEIPRLKPALRPWTAPRLHTNYSGTLPL